MFDNTRASRWVVIVFFTAIIVFFTYFIVFLIMGSTDPYYKQRAKRPVAGQEAPRAVSGLKLGDQLILVRNKTVADGQLKITYRGKSAGELRLEVISLALDPHYAYPRRIPIRAARNGFWLFDRQFRLLSISQANMRLMPVNP